MRVAASVFEYYAGITDKIEFKMIPSSNNTFNYVVLEPYGVSLQIIPWNYPISLFARSVAVSLVCLLYTSPSPRDRQKSGMPSSA